MRGMRDLERVSRRCSMTEALVVELVFPRMFSQECFPKWI